MPLPKEATFFSGFMLLQRYCHFRCLHIAFICQPRRVAFDYAALSRFIFATPFSLPLLLIISP